MHHQGTLHLLDRRDLPAGEQVMHVLGNFMGPATVQSGQAHVIPRRTPVIQSGKLAGKDYLLAGECYVASLLGEVVSLLVAVI